DLGGGSIFEVTIPSGSSTAAFRFRDTQSVSSGGRVRAIDTGLAPPYLGTGEASVVTTPADPAGTVVLTATPDTLAADGVSTTNVASAIVRDAFGNAVLAGAAFTATGSLLAPAGDADGGTPGIQWITDASGIVSGSAQAGIVKGSGSVTIASLAGSATGSAPVRLLAGVPSGSIALVATPDSIAADGASSTSVSASGLADANGNQVEDGERYTVTSDLGSIVTADADAGTPGIQVESSSGAISFTLRAGALLGTAAVTATSVRGAAAGSTQVVFVPGAVDSALSTLSATSPAAVGAVGSSATVTLRDAQGHPLPGVPAGSIALSVAGVPATVTPLAAATDANGAIDFRVTTTLADTASISVTALGAPLAASASIVFLAGGVDHYTAGGPAPPLLAGRPESLLVTARDLYENPAPAAGGSRLSVRVIGGLAIAPDTVTFTGATADVPFTPTAVTQLSLLLREVVAPLRSVSYGPVAVSPAGPYAIDSVAVAATTLSTGDSTSVELWIEDAYGNRQPGATVSAATLSGGGNASPANAITDAAGRALFRVHAGPAPGPVSIRFLAVGSPAPDAVRSDTVTVAVVAGAAAAIEIANSTGGIVAGGLLNVTLTLRDAFGNVATTAAPLVRLRTSTPQPSLDNIRWSLTAGAAGALSDSASSDAALYQFVAGDSGTATVAVRDTLAETIVLRAGGAALPLAETAPVTIVPAPPTQIAVVSGDAQSGVVADTLALPLRVRARDSFGNLTPGAVVRFTVTGGGGTIDAVLGGGADPDAVADATGTARADVWRLGTLAGAAQNARAALVA
ncbi:MAG TPA: Ig-like domain-containing protein, partial [Candidatus Eisenbacteria bacterium]